jgi:hypothetical protein
MKKGYYIIIIILLGILVFTKILSIFINKDDKTFVLPGLDDEISLYDESAFVIKDTYVSYITTNGYVEAYQYKNILILYWLFSICVFYNKSSLYRLKNA